MCIRDSYSTEEVKAQATGRALRADVEALAEVVSAIQPLAAYLGVAMAVLPAEHEWSGKVIALQEEQLARLRDARQWRQPHLRSSLTSALENLKSEYIQLYLALHRSARLNAAEDERKKGLLNDPRQKQLTALSSIEFLPVADLEKGAHGLHEVIAELEQVMAREFRQTFLAIAERFKEYFSMLFGGGSARLSLTDGDSLATTGIEIIARPPGKRPQSLALLSGGERALTAAALIFSVLSVSPPPFCILDEVDAALDEANVGRFRDALGRLARDTQFIVITHNRGTVEAARTIYGVSMSTDNASQVLSLRLEEVPGDADERKVEAGRAG